VYPDGGLSRLRLFGELDAASAADTYQRWWDALPASHRSLIPRHAPR
jgi:allantoicase